MPGYGAPKRVRLTVDLTKYDSRCTEGSLGTTTNGSDGWASFDHFTEVVFDSGARLPVLWKSLDVIGQRGIAGNA
jgi:hypothetical protein